MHDQVAVVEDRTVKLSNPQKVLFPAAGLTKADLVDYYRRVARVMLPHLAGRPLSFERYPEGVAAEGFMQKNASDYFPSWLRRVRLAKQDGVVDHIVAEDQAALIYLANQACITFHVWLSRIDRVDYPDRMVFDLDPSADDFGKVKRAAREARGAARGARPGAVPSSNRFARPPYLGAARPFRRFRSGARVRLRGGGTAGRAPAQGTDHRAAQG
jgi:DNA primase